METSSLRRRRRRLTRTLSIKLQALQGLPVRSLHPRTLVEIDLSRRRLPVDPRVGSLIDPKGSRQADSPRQFEQRSIQHQQVGRVAEQNLPRVQAPSTEDGGDIDIRAHPGRALCPAPVVDVRPQAPAHEVDARSLALAHDDLASPAAQGGRSPHAESSPSPPRPRRSNSWASTASASSLSSAPTMTRCARPSPSASRARASRSVRESALSTSLLAPSAPSGPALAPSGPVTIPSEIGSEEWRYWCSCPNHRVTLWTTYLYV